MRKQRRPERYSRELPEMAEVGLVRFGQVAMEVASAALPAYSHKFSPHRFTQHQLVAILMLMRYEDWTFREAEVRLQEHSELRAALGLERTPDHSTLHHFMLRLDEEKLVRLLEECVRKFKSPPAGAATIAIDATGLAGPASVYYIKSTGQDRRGYTKWLIAVELQGLLIAAQLVERGPSGSQALLAELLHAASGLGPVELVLADAEFDSELNHTFIRSELGALSVIPAKRVKPGHGAHGVRARMRYRFPAHIYSARSLVETVFSVVKRKLSAKTPGRSERVRRLWALVLGVAYDIYRIYLRLPQCNLPTQHSTHHCNTMALTQSF
jgi:hypothetical protein